MGRMSFLVNTLVAFALLATVLSAALLVGLFPVGGGTSVATSRPPGTFVPGTASPTATPVVTVAPPTATPEPTINPGEGGTYVVRPGDSLSIIGIKFGIPWQQIAEANNIAGPDYIIAPGQVLTIPPISIPTQGTDFYIVKSGDTITGIALQFDVNPTDLADFNNIADWNSIRVGDILYIPGPGWTPLPEASF